jgi:hypothetical protein
VNEKHKLQPTEKYENTLNDAKHCKIIWDPDGVGRPEPQSQEEKADADKGKKYVNEVLELQPSEKHENPLNEIPVAKKWHLE